MNEGLSNSVLEYMAAGLPVVASDHGGNQELIEQAGAGLLVPCEDHTALADALARLLRDPKRAAAMGRWGRPLCRGAACAGQGSFGVSTAL